MATSLEYLGLKKYRSDVEKTIKSDPKWFAEELNVDETVLTDAKYNELTNPRSMLTDDEKAGEMVKHLLDRVDLDPDALREFLEILKKKDKKFRPLMDKLQGVGKFIFIPGTRVHTYFFTSRTPPSSAYG